MKLIWQLVLHPVWIWKSEIYSDFLADNTHGRNSNVVKLYISLRCRSFCIPAARVWSPYKDLQSVVEAAVHKRQTDAIHDLEIMLKKHKSDFLSLLKNIVSFINKVFINQHIHKKIISFSMIKIRLTSYGNLLSILFAQIKAFLSYSSWEKVEYSENSDHSSVITTNHDWTVMWYLKA